MSTSGRFARDDRAEAMMSPWPFLVLFLGVVGAVGPVPIAATAALVDPRGRAEHLFAGVATATSYVGFAAAAATWRPAIGVFVPIVVAAIAVRVHRSRSDGANRAYLAAVYGSPLLLGAFPLALLSAAS